MQKFVVVDEILEQLESAKSGVIPESITQAVVSGINNNPAQIIQMKGSAGGSCYTTFPISPIIKNCCLDKTYLNLEFDNNFKITVTGLTAANTHIIPFYIGFRDTASIFNQIQILIENSVIYNTNYQREESVVSYNSLPETEIRGNTQYSSIDKLINKRTSPMKRIILKDTGTNLAGGIDITIHFKLTVDINRLSPIISNLHFTTPHFGNLQLKVWIQRIQEAMFFCPDYNYFNAVKATAGIVLTQPCMNSYYQFYPLASILETGTIAKTVIPIYGYDTTSFSNALATNFKIEFNNNPFMSFSGGVAEIVQTCFDISESEYNRLTEFFASNEAIIIPTQTFITGTFNDSNIYNSWVSTQTASIGGYNINFVATWTHPQNQATCFTNEFLQHIQLLIDGRPVNALPYEYVNDKCVVDCTQAIIDTDHEEINQDFVTSLSAFNDTGDSSYLSDSLTNLFADGSIDHALNISHLSNPNTFMLVFSTNLPDAFHSGFCTLENSNRTAVIRLNSTSACDTNGSLQVTTFPLLINHKSKGSLNISTITTGYTAFCDCCIALTYDKNRGKCYDGRLSWASPFVSEA